MREMQQDLVRSNIARYEGLLKAETNPVTRRTLQSLLAEAHHEATLLKAESALERMPAISDELLWHAQQWRLKAAECRILGGASESASARGSYLNMAQRYDILADGAAAKAKAQGAPNAER